MNVTDEEVHNILKFIANKANSEDIDLETKFGGNNDIIWYMPTTKTGWSFYALDKNNCMGWIDIGIAKKDKDDINAKRKCLLDDFLKKSAKGLSIYVANSGNEEDLLVLSKNSTLESILIEMDLERC